MTGHRARIVQLVLAAFAFGVLASVVKGNGAGVRDGIGNLSAPWAILPLVASAAVARGRIAHGAVIGSVVTAAALFGFYLANAFVLDLGPHTTLQGISLAFRGGSMWIKAGAVSGPVMGAAGAWATRRGHFTVAVIAFGIVCLEPLAVYLAYLGSSGFFAAGGGEWNGVYAGEAGIGAVAVAALWGVRVSGRRSQ